MSLALKFSSSGSSDSLSAIKHDPTHPLSGRYPQELRSTSSVVFRGEANLFTASFLMARRVGMSLGNAADPGGPALSRARPGCSAVRLEGPEH